MPYRLLTFLLAFLIPPFLVASIGALSTMNQVMLPIEPEPVEVHEVIGAPEFVKSQDDPEKLNAVIVTSKAGTQVSEVLMTYGLLSESGKFNVMIASNQTNPIPFTGGVSVYPEVSFEAAPKPDLLVIPSLLDTRDKAVLDFLRKQVDITPIVLALGEGTRIIAEMGWLDGFKATTHPLAFDTFASEFKNTKFIKNVSVVEDRSLISSTGIKTTEHAVLTALHRLFGREKAVNLSKEKNIVWIPQENQESAFQTAGISSLDFSYLALRAAFLWEKLAVGIYLYPGMSEIGLAAIADTFPRSMSTRTVALGEIRQPILTKNGLKLLPSIAIEDAPLLDSVIVPAGVSSRKNDPKYLPLNGKNTDNYLREFNVTAKSFQHVYDGEAYEKALGYINQTEGYRISEIISRLIVYPEWEPSQAFLKNSERVSMWSLLLRPFAIGLVGLLLAFTFERRMRRKSGYDNLNTIQSNNQKTDPEIALAQSVNSKQKTETLGEAPVNERKSNGKDSELS